MDDTDWWGQFQKTDLSNDVPWSEAYPLGGYRAIWDHSLPSPELVGYMLGARLGAGARVLDVGCGSGRDAIFPAGCGLEVHGFDFSAEALDVAKDRARERNTVVSWHLGSVLNAPFDSGYFDLITDRGCFHHIGGPRRAKYAEEIARILKAGGVLFLRGCRRPEPPFSPSIPRRLRKLLTSGYWRSVAMCRSISLSMQVACRPRW